MVKLCFSLVRREHSPKEQAHRSWLRCIWNFLLTQALPGALLMPQAVQVGWDLRRAPHWSCLFLNHSAGEQHPLLLEIELRLALPQPVRPLR